MFLCLEVFCKDLLLGEGWLVHLETVPEGGADSLIARTVHESMLEGLDFMKLTLVAEL